MTALLRLMPTCAVRSIKGQRYISSTDVSRVKQYLDNIPDLEFFPIRLGDGGCSVGRPNQNSFSNGFVDVEPVLSKDLGLHNDTHGETKTKGFRPVKSFKSFFEEAFNCLNSMKPGVQRDHKYEGAFEILNNFLQSKDFHERCFHKGLRNALEEIKYSTNSDDDSATPLETTVAVLLAIHLLSKITAKENDLTYAVSSDYKKKPQTCPCEMCTSRVVYASTYIGTEDLFLGKPDIVLFPQRENQIIKPVNVVYASSHKKSDSKMIKTMHRQNESHFVEVERHSNPLQTNNTFNQVVIQAITFSLFYRTNMEKKIEEETHTKNFSMKSCLVPTIAICDDGFNIFMYDSVNDHFWVSEPELIPMFVSNGRAFSLDSIIYLWMVINHSLFLPNISESDLELTKGTFGLFSRYLNNDYYQRVKETMSMDVQPYGSKYRPLQMRDIEKRPLSDLKKKQP